MGGLVALLGLLVSCETPQAPATCLPLSHPLGTSSPDLPGRVLSEPDDEVAFVYDQAALHSFELQIAPDNLAFLDADPTAEVYVPGTLVFEGASYGPVGVRYKGSIGAFFGCTANQEGFSMSGAKTCSDLNFKVSFNHYDPDGRFFGVKKLLFHAMRTDDSRMRERLGYWLFRQMGVPAPRAAHMRLSLNGRSMGAYLNVEYIDGRFTRSHFEDGKGNLYKEAWPTSRHPEAAGGPMTPGVISEGDLRDGLRTNEDDDPSVDRMLRFSGAVVAEDGDSRARALQAWMNLDNILAYIAVDRTIRLDDGLFHFYCDDNVCGNHNVYLYEEASSDRIWLIPWDLDNAFVVGGALATDADRFLELIGRWNDDTIPCQGRAGVEWWSPRQMPSSCDPLLNALGCYYTPTYHAAVQTLLAGPFREEVVNARLDTWANQVSASIAEGHVADPERLSPEQWSAGLADLRQRLVRLRGVALDELAYPGPDVTSELDPSSPEPVNADVVINEVVPRSEEGDWLELHNRGGEAVDLGGWFVSDSDPAHVRILSAGRILEPGGHLLLRREGAGGFGFGLGGADTLTLFAADGAVVDTTAWEGFGEESEGLSWGRSPDGTGDFTTLSAPTPGEANGP